MDSMATAGLGAGMLKGLEMYRRYRREDERDEQRREFQDMTMRRGEQAYDQREQLFPGQLELQGLQLQGQQVTNQREGLGLEMDKRTAPYKVRSLERADKKGERDAWASDVSYKAQRAVQSALGGDINALNEFSAEINPGLESPPMVLPSETPGMVRYVANGQEQELPLRDIIRRTAELGNPSVVMERAMSGGGYGAIENRDGVGYGQMGPDGKWNPINVKNSGGGALQGGGGGSGLDNATQSLIERTARQYWGSMNAEGAFIIPEDARDNYLATQQRAVELAGTGLPAQVAVNYAALSLSGPLSQDEAQMLAEQELSAGAG